MGDDDQREKKGSDYYAPRAEPFDAVMLKTGVSPLDAKPDDFMRVHVVATDAAAAREGDEVKAAAATGYQLHQLVGPGVRTQDEHRAQERAHQEALGPRRDRTAL
jgi:hypothetical protein